MSSVGTSEASNDACADPRAAPLSQLLTSFREGSADVVRSRAAAEILRRFEPLLRKYCYSLGQLADSYEDFVQEVMLRVLIALPKLRQPLAFPGLMRHIVVSTAVDIWRKRGRENEEPVKSFLVAQDLAAAFDRTISTALVVRSCLEVLPPREREVIELLVVYELEVAEAARRLMLTAATVRMVKSRAIKRLRNVLAQK